MKITARAEIDDKQYIIFPNELKRQLVQIISNELLYSGCLVESNSTLTMELECFVLSGSDIDKLINLVEKYPELDDIINNIIVNKK